MLIDLRQCNCIEVTLIYLINFVIRKVQAKACALTEVSFDSWHNHKLGCSVGVLSFDFGNTARKLDNRPFPSSLVPLLQSESKRETIHMKMKLHAELIFRGQVSHFHSFLNRGTIELGNGRFRRHQSQEWDTPGISFKVIVCTHTELPHYNLRSFLPSLPTSHPY